MTLHLDMMDSDTEYYYSENGVSYGPFILSDLLPKITPETLVYREGIDWTMAKDIEELSKFFVVITPEVNHPATPNSTKKGKSLILVLILLLLVSAAGVGYYFWSRPKTSTQEEIKPISMKVYASIKKKNKIDIGCLSVTGSDEHFGNCLQEVFGDRLIKYKHYDKLEDLLNDMNASAVDMVLLTTNEAEPIRNILEFSSEQKWDGYSDKIVIGLPFENSNHLENLDNCIK